VAALTGHTDNGAVSAAAHCFLEPNPLLLELCASAEPPAWVDLMLEELVASLVVSWPAGATATGDSLALAPASQETEASLVDTRSPAKTA
jgi:hypothetical protein